ncbi:MAG TPA: hypothetical protein PLP19_11060 [bacterium]|nr:hypothetical protein [bacterium]HPN44020.1 hypothetical protein [bacterium]
MDKSLLPCFICVIQWHITFTPVKILLSGKRLKNLFYFPHRDMNPGAL